MLTAVTVAVVLCVAVVSWHLIEKPVLSLRRFALTGRVTGAGESRAAMAPAAALEGSSR
jgi:peptidoglycan/LPS O-acetylase OafA/YrhL